MKLIRPGLVPYGQALAWQLALRERLQSGDADDPVGYLLCLEHPPVVTLGKRGTIDAIFGLDELKQRDTQFFKIDRGGEATYHGPGQLVVYPIIKLDQTEFGVVDIIRGMARCLADTLDEYGVGAAYDADHPGLWTTDQEPKRKIASVGMRVSGGVTTHGAAINLVNDLTPFSMFVPCGMPNAPMTRLVDWTDHDVDVDDFTDRFLEHFSAFLGESFDPADPDLPPRDQWVSPMAV